MSIENSCVSFGVLEYVLGQFGHILILTKTPGALDSNVNWIESMEPLWDDHPNQVYQ